MFKKLYHIPCNKCIVILHMTRNLAIAMTSHSLSSYNSRSGWIWQEK